MPGYCRRELRGKQPSLSPWSHLRKHWLKSGKAASSVTELLPPTPSCHESETYTTHEATPLFHPRFWARRPSVKAVGGQEWNWACPGLLTGAPRGSVALFWCSPTSPRGLHKCQPHIPFVTQPHPHSSTFPNSRWLCTHAVPLALTALPCAFLPVKLLVLQCRQTSYM